MCRFAILMTGMTMMSGAVKPLADLPQFKEVLTILDNPIIAILVGAGITALIQSSAASLGILQSLAMTGSISFSMALPVIMGRTSVHVSRRCFPPSAPQKAQSA